MKAMCMKFDSSKVATILQQFFCLFDIIELIFSFPYQYAACMRFGNRKKGTQKYRKGYPNAIIIQSYLFLCNVHCSADSFQWHFVVSFYSYLFAHIEMTKLFNSIAYFCKYDFCFFLWRNQIIREEKEKFFHRIPFIRNEVFFFNFFAVFNSCSLRENR